MYDSATATYPSDFNPFSRFATILIVDRLVKLDVKAYYQPSYHECHHRTRVRMCIACLQIQFEKESSERSASDFSAVLQLQIRNASYACPL